MSIWLLNAFASKAKELECSEWWAWVLNTTQGKPKNLNYVLDGFKEHKLPTKDIIKLHQALRAL